jgi:hypothetical protein
VRSQILGLHSSLLILHSSLGTPMIRAALALVISLALAVAVRATDLPTGTWAANMDGNKGDLVIKSAKDGKATGSLLGTDFDGTWDGKALTFRIGKDVYEAHLVSEPGEKGQTKYTLTGTRATPTGPPNRAAGLIHYAKTGWYAQLSAETPAPTGEIKAEVRGVLVVDGTTAYVSVKRKVGSEVEETRVWVQASEGEWKLLKQTLPPLNGKEVVVTGSLAQTTTRNRDDTLPRGTLYFRGAFDIKAAPAPK